jgi:lipopolysaccharide/colanic/teichoic acid biosynthesis glycosyltransferase
MLLREQKTDTIISLSRNHESKELISLLDLSRIYGIAFVYPKFLPERLHLSTREGYIGNMPIIEIISVSIGIWERILKRTIDICAAIIGCIIFLPLFLIIALIIKLEDPAGPIFFANRRVGQGGKIFSLYKFRYMYWKYSVKDAYGVDPADDTALKYEETLRAKNNTRTGPLYKIKWDPRKMRCGKILEKFSLVGPRPHQPREVDLYDESDRQVLTVKPGITGMAQVYGRDTNSFQDEIKLDRSYIESYSLWLDLAILIRTFGVVSMRIWQRE